MHYPGTTMQGSYLDAGGFQSGLYGSLNYDNGAIKLHPGHFTETPENCYSGYTTNPVSGTYSARDPPSYSESTVFQNGFVPNSTSSYYKVAGRGVADPNEYGAISRDSMMLKTDVIDSNLSEVVMNHRFDNDGTLTEMNNVPADPQQVQQHAENTHTHSQQTQQHPQQTLKLEEMQEFKTDLSLQETMSPNSSSECVNSVDIKDHTDTPGKVDELEEVPAAVEEDKARGNSDIKPALSYIALIAKSILESAQKRLSLGSIYSWIEKNYPYYVNKGQGWRNSVRHNLSLNDCFIKAGRCEDGKGNYWAIHPANIQDFMRGDFRQRRRSRRRGRKKDCDLGMYHMTNGYIGATAPLAATGVPFNPTPALSSIYSPYTEAERRAYRLDDALLRQNMGNSFMKWYHGNGSYGNQTSPCNTAGLYGSSSPQWQTAAGYGEQTSQGVYQLNAFSPRNYTPTALV